MEDIGEAASFGVLARGERGSPGKLSGQPRPLPMENIGKAASFGDFALGARVSPGKPDSGTAALRSVARQYARRRCAKVNLELLLPVLMSKEVLGGKRASLSPQGVSSSYWPQERATHFGRLLPCRQRKLATR
jgi:hypothetical protein